MMRYQASINTVSILFTPLNVIDPPATIHLFVFSDEPIRVRRIKKVIREYPQEAVEHG